MTKTPPPIPDANIPQPDPMPSTPRVLKYRWIILTMFIEMALLTAMNVVSSGTVALVIVPLLSGIGWWQMGVLTERNDWVAGRHVIQRQPKAKPHD